MVQNLEYYKVFYHVARCGSLTLAAQELSISQPAVSQSVKLLETSVGVKLFVRSAKGVKLTKEGELLYSYVAGGYEQIEMGEKKLKQMMDLELGEIRIGASDMTLRFYLLPYLERFHELCPGHKGYGDQCADAGNPGLSEKRENRFWRGDAPRFQAREYTARPSGK